MSDVEVEKSVGKYWNIDDWLKLVNNFTYHTPIGDQHFRYEKLRLDGKYLAQVILGECPPSRERSLALTKLEEVIMWANASIARNETEGG